MNTSADGCFGGSPRTADCLPPEAPFCMGVVGRARLCGANNVGTAGHCSNRAPRRPQSCHQPCGGHAPLTGFEPFFLDRQQSDWLLAIGGAAEYALFDDPGRVHRCCVRFAVLGECCVTAADGPTLSARGAKRNKMTRFIAALVLLLITCGNALAIPPLPHELSQSDFAYMNDYIMSGNIASCHTALLGSVKAQGDTKLATPWAACSDDLLKRHAAKRAIDIANNSVNIYCAVRYGRHEDTATKHLAACQRYY